MTHIFVGHFRNIRLFDFIEIDYSGLKEGLGRISAVPFVRSSSAAIDHRHGDGVYRVKLGDMVGPGEGVVLVFRGRKDMHGI
jgi:hypothetical protein